jgi:hypothetical protein
MADVQIGQGTTPTENQQKKKRFRNAKEDFLALIEVLGPLYDGLDPEQRATQIANFANFQSLTQAQKDNAQGFALALLAIGMDFLARAD